MSTKGVSENSSISDPATETTNESSQCEHMIFDCIHSFEKTPVNLRGNFIINHYRVNYTWKTCLKSMFQLHNETLNVWTHLLGVFLFLYLFFFTLNELTHLEETSLMAQLDHYLPQINLKFDGEGLRNQSGLDLAMKIVKDKLAEGSDQLHYFQDLITQRAEEASTQLHEKFDNELHEIEAYAQEAIKILFSKEEGLIREGARWPMLFYLVTALLCMLFSSLYHLFGCHHNPHIQVMFGRLDFCGITLLIFGSFIPVIFYITSFGAWRMFYMGSLSVITLTMITFSLCDWFYQPKYRVIRTGCFVSMAAYGLVPFIYMLSVHGPFNSILIKPTLYLFSMGASFLIGVVFFLSHFPERCCPGKFDIWFHSHQFWHLCVIGGALSQYVLAVSLWRLSPAL
jgi:adiponectin receptor